MKKLILTAVAVGVVGFGAQSAQAGDREWATVGKVLTGVAAGVAIANALDCEPVYASASYGYAAPGYRVTYTVSTPAPCPPPARVVYTPPPRVVCAPAPVVVYQPVVYTPRRVYAPAPVYHAARGHHERGRAYGHWKR